MIYKFSMDSADENSVDFRYLFDCLRRRWLLVIGGAAFGVICASVWLKVEFDSPPQARSAIIVDMSQSPCYVSLRRIRILPTAYVRAYDCIGEANSSRVLLDKLARDVLFDKDKALKNRQYKLKYEIKNLKLKSSSTSDPFVSDTHLVLEVVAPLENYSDLSEKLKVIQSEFPKNMPRVVINNAIVSPDIGWLRIEGPAPIIFDKSKLLFRSIFLGLLSGLIVGAGASLVADGLSNRIYSQRELLRLLGFPLVLRLPASRWSSTVSEVLIPQFAVQLNPEISWKVLSIAREHHAVAPLTQLLQRAAPEVSFEHETPLFSKILNVEASGKSVGLLLVVEGGFNSLTALDDARLLISQMSTVKSVGVVLLGSF